ncbi:MAG: HU family DNA-binding protein, partial [Treponema sp.]|nr:HU family DNA-binding protein [Treponema sp.]
MNKTELVDAIAKDTGLTKKDSEAALKSFIDNVTKALKKGDDVALVGFGTFAVGKRAART